MPKYRLGIDIGGTFTDLVLLDEESGSLSFGKTLTTYDNPTNGIIKGTQELLEKNRLQSKELSDIVHGTTLVTNAVIERKGSKTGFITTAGFEDVLEIGREFRYDIYDIFLTMPKPLVPRNLRIGLKERIDHKGRVLKELNKAEIEEKVQSLVDLGVQSIGVCLLHSYANTAHEQMVAEVLKEKFPSVYFSLSSEVMPEIREYERSSATAMNAYVQPITDQYLQNLEDRLRALSFEGVINIMISSGRLTTIDGARKTPIQLLESGPAGGTMAGVFFGKMLAKNDLVTFDMGGTTAKASMIIDGKPEITNHFEAGRVKRFKKGSGLPVRIPVVDMIEIGAGGGSIAHIDHLGLLKVGPESAASEPGPACYGRGGVKPTVTDADLILGYLNEDYFLGGTMKLDRHSAEKAIKEHIADPLGITVEEAALGIHRIVNENMAGAARVHIIEKGYDPRLFSVMAFGGAGPVHAFQVARLLRAPQLIIPVGAGVTSALGFLVSPVAAENIRSHISVLERMDWAKVNAFLEEMEDEGFQFLLNAGIDPKLATITRVADMRYTGQGHEINVAIPNGKLGRESVAEIKENFLVEYKQRYSKVIQDVPMETVTWRVVVSGPKPEITPRQLVTAREKGVQKTRMVRFPELPKAIECPVFDRYALRPGQAIAGPAIIEEMESTTVVGPDSAIRVDNYNNIIIDLHY